ncbi:MAG TPA: hypothetical protein PK668_18735 [Myxococcota bacterium]|nr:hypothetical protein [Myxococcota bacterium]HRY96589.1 hypothetical protein [Myxococcota bacterium]HSA20858.1 hypothetical protein [Myxococcota bacterium]
MAEDKKDNVVLIRQPPLKRGDRRLLERAQALFELQEQLCVATSAIRRLQALDDQEADELATALGQITSRLEELLTEAQDLLMKHYRK